MGSSDRSSPLDPALRQRLLQEARSPWRGLRRALWFALSASAFLGLATMTMRLSAGEAVAGSDLLIQISALLVCGLLLAFDRQRPAADGDDS
ncbi:MAG: DUF3493 domain-containing protein [Synechococcaceae cyanobacterium]|jgi:hypothetical protein